MALDPGSVIYPLAWPGILSLALNDWWELRVAPGGRVGIGRLGIGFSGAARLRPSGGRLGGGATTDLCGVWVREILITSSTTRLRLVVGVTDSTGKIVSTEKRRASPFESYFQRGPHRRCHYHGRYRRCLGACCLSGFGWGNSNDHSGFATFRTFSRRTKRPL